MWKVGSSYRLSLHYYSANGAFNVYGSYGSLSKMYARIALFHAVALQHSQTPDNIFMHRKPSRIRKLHAHILAVTQDREKLTVFAPAKVAQHTGHKVHHLRYKALGQRNVLQKNQIASIHTWYCISRDILESLPQLSFGTLAIHTANPEHFWFDTVHKKMVCHTG